MKTRSRFAICTIAGLAVAFAARPVTAGADIAPAFETLTSAGQPWKLADHRGKLVLLNFFSEICTHCREEVPMLTRLQKDHAGSLVVAGIAKDMQKPADAARLGASFGCGYPVLTDGSDSKLSDAFKVYGLPHSVLIDETGTVEGVYRGIFPETLDELTGKIRDGSERLKALREAFAKGVPGIAIGPFEAKNEAAARKDTGGTIETVLKAAFKGTGGKELLRVRGTAAASERSTFIEYRVEDLRGRLWAGPETIKVKGEDYSPLVTAVTAQIDAVGKQIH